MAEVLSDSQFEKFKKTIYDASGITFTASNKTVLDSRIREVLREKQLESPDQLFEMINNDQAIFKEFLDKITTNLTHFFRNQIHFDTLTNYVVPKLLEEKKASGNTKFRIWSAGCSTGEEPYTIAMVMKEILPPGYTFEIVASDISLKSLMIGQQGHYAANKVEGIPPAYLAKYFDKTENGYQAKKELMQTIKFDYHNLRHNSGLQNMDIVFCRNVLIYFDEAAMLSTVEKFYDTLGKHGYLFIGHSESLFGMKTRFEFLRTDWACIYEKKSSGSY